jgi:hypothetical protein
MWSILTALPKLAGNIFEFLNKKQDVNLEKYRIDGQVNMSLVAAEIEIIKARAAAFSNLTWVHYGFGLVTLLYYSAIIFDCITEMLLGWRWDVQPLGGSAEIWGGMIMSFFFLHATLTSYFRR